jgi:hypothetical protein
MRALDVDALAAAAGRSGSAPIRVTPALVDAWRQVHHAAQIASEVGKAWGVAQPDDSHSTFEWLAGALVGVPIAGEPPFRAALRVESLTLELRDLQGKDLAVRPLAGTRFADGLTWVREVAAKLAGGGPRQRAVPAPDLPAHPVSRGAPFALADPSAFADLARLLGGADAVLRRIAESSPEAGPVRCWPHHFDLATLFEVGRAPDGSATRTIGIGLTVPDSVEASGYWYVSPWSAVPTKPGPDAALPRGRWLPRGALAMALLPLAEIAALDAARERHEAVARFLADAFAACRERLTPT